MVILFSQYRQFTGLLFFQPLENSFVFILWCGLQKVISQSFILPRLNLASILKLLLDLELFRLKVQKNV